MSSKAQLQQVHPTTDPESTKRHGKVLRLTPAGKALMKQRLTVLCAEPKAIFETNRNTVPKRLSAAEQALLARGRELFQQARNLEEFEEREEVDIALYCLRAYKNACSHAERA